MEQEEKEIIRNLLDAGCSEDTITAFMKYRKMGNREEGFRILRDQRKSLLDDVHLGEKKIGCLDYLVYQMKREKV